MHSVQVPQDIINLIIDDVAASYHDAPSVNNHPLLNCALVSRSFHWQTTHHIFSRVELVQPWDPVHDEETLHQQTVRLADILAGNPAIGPSVRILIIRPNSDEGTGKMFPQAMEREREFWTKENHALIYVLKRLSTLQQFAIHGGFPWRMWSEVHHTSACALKDIITAPSLLRLDFRGLSNLPPEIILNCLHIKHVTFDNIDVCDIPMGQPISTGCHDNYSALPFVLESARLSSCTSAINLLLGIPEKISVFSRLCKLQVYIQTDEDIWPSWCVMLQAASTLEILDLTWSGHPTSNVTTSILHIRH